MVAAAEHGALLTMLATLPAHGSLLEVGCGSGHFTRWFAARSTAVVGLDPSPGMLAVAHETGGPCQYVQGVAEHLPFADASVEIVAFITTLEFLASPAAALQEAARVARTGILLGVLNLASALGVQRRLASVFRPSVYRSARFFTVWTLRRLVQRTLSTRSQALHWTTAVWPRSVPSSVRPWLPLGGFLAMAVQLKRPGKGAVPWPPSQRK